MKPLRIAAALCAAALAACGGRQLDDVARYVAELEASPGPALAPLPEFGQLTPAAYQAGGGRSPFEPPAVSAGPDARLGAGRVAPDFNRPQQPLEAFPASALGLVGTIAKGAVRIGLVVDAEGGVHEVRSGDYLGQDHGRVRRVGEAAIEFVEILPDGGGGWVRRSGSLVLAGAEE